MATYRFRLIEKHAQLIGVHYLSFESDADAIQHGDTTVGEYDCAHVEVWAGDNLISAAIRRLK
jgi:hypothetical protein